MLVERRTRRPSRWIASAIIILGLAATGVYEYAAHQTNKNIHPLRTHVTFIHDILAYPKKYQFPLETNGFISRAYPVSDAAIVPDPDRQFLEVGTLS